MSSCKRAGRLIAGCKFSPRFDLSPAAYPDGSVTTTAAAMFSIMETTRTKTYVRDVCERCGKTIER